MKTKQLYELADYILHQAHEEGRQIINLKLQQILYRAYRQILLNDKHIRDAQHDESETPFEVGKYGPIVPDIYHEFQVYGDDPIQDHGRNSKFIAALDVDDIIHRSLSQPTYKMIDHCRLNQFWIDNSKIAQNGVAKVNYRVRDLVK